MSKNNNGNLVVEKISDKDLESWAKWLGTGAEPEGGEKQIERMSKRVANLADTASIINYLIEVDKADTMRYLKMIVERLSVMEYIVTDKLGVGVEEFKEYNERYNKEMAEAMKLMEEAQAGQSTEEEA